MYLMSPDGQFHDYFGQNRKAKEIAGVIRSKSLKWEIDNRALLNQLVGSAQKMNAS